MDNDKVLILLEKIDWKDVILRLTHYAIWRSRRYYWKRGISGQLLAGKTPEDIACVAIEKVLSGKREWDPEKYPNLLTHLEWIVNSDMEHLFSSMEHQTTGNLPMSQSGEELETDSCELCSDPTLNIYGKLPSPEDALIASENKEREKELVNKLFNLVRGDEDLEMLLLCFEEGIDKPEDIAAQTGFDISKVYNLKRKLLRKAAKLGSLLRNGEHK